MALSGIQPFIKVTDSNGLPIVGAKLHVYEAGTTTYRNIYSDDGLSVSLSNPLTGVNASNASGDFPRFYMASGTYKLRAEESDGTLIWEYDDIDTALSAGAGALPIASGGTGATTAAAARANLDVPSNSELADVTDQIADISASIASVISQPGGRLTLTSNTPVLSADVSAATAVYYTPYTSDICPIYNGSQFTLSQFSELTLTLASQHTASNIFDCFIINDAGTIRIVTGPAWSVATVGSGARGTGGGTTELTRVRGIWVNANSMGSARNGASTYSVAANQGTYVGTLFIDGTNGQITCHSSLGVSRKWGVWNAYNRKQIILEAALSTANWSGTGLSTWRASNGSSTSSLSILTGLPEEMVDTTFTQTMTVQSSVVSNTGQIGIGFNSTSAQSGTIANLRMADANAIANQTQLNGTPTAQYKSVPTIGVHVITSLEWNNSSTVTYYGSSNAFMALRSRYTG